MQPGVLLRAYCPAWYCHEMREGGVAEEPGAMELVSTSVDTAVEGNHGGAKLVRAWNLRSK